MTAVRSANRSGFIGKRVTLYIHGGVKFGGPDVSIVDVLFDHTDGCDWLILSDGWTVQYDAIAAAKWHYAKDDEK